MKAVYWLPIVALAGIVVGSWSSREELRAYKNLGSVDDGRRSARRRGADGFDTFARLVQIPDAASRPRRKAPTKPSGIAATNSVAAARQKPADEKPAEESSADANPPRERRRSDLGARIAEARELWSARVDMARAQWKSRLKLSGEAEAAFDSALRDMNDRLHDSISALAEIVSEQKKLSPETGLRLMGETATVMAEAYDRIGECVAPELRGEVGDINMVDFIDPGAAEPLVGVQDELEAAADAARKNGEANR